MRDGEHVLLLGHPRSGSSNVYQILQSHPLLDLLEEPFNERFTSWDSRNKDYRSIVRDIYSLDMTLHEIFERWNGLKVLDYQLSEDLLDHLVTRPDMVVTSIRRRNLLQAAVSGLIAERTGLWKIWDADRPLASYYEGLDPLDIDLVQERMDWVADCQHRTQRLVERRTDGRFWRVDYEDLFFADEAAQADLLASLWTFLDLEPIGPDALDYYLRPERTKLNSASTSQACSEHR